MLNSKKIIRPFVLTKDPLVQRILERFAKRSENGIKKYGRTMVDATKSIDEWIDDAQEESWDKIVYLEKIKIELQKKEGEKDGKKEKEKER
jgi:hypothetical protein